MMAITTNNSMSVKPNLPGLVMVTPFGCVLASHSALRAPFTSPPARVAEPPGAHGRAFDFDAVESKPRSDACKIAALPDAQRLT
jgi:hypothetical protein